MMLFVFLLVQCVATVSPAQSEEDWSRTVTSTPTPLGSSSGWGERVVDDLRREIAALTGRIEILEHQYETHEKLVNERLSQLSNRLESLRTSQGSGSGSAQADRTSPILNSTDPSSSSVTGQATSVASPARSNPIEDRLHALEERISKNTAPTKGPDLLVQGQNALKDKDYANASVLLGSYCALPDAKKLDEGQFLLGESLFAQEKYKDAIYAYSKVGSQNARTPRMSAAIFQIGCCFSALKLDQDARGFYQELIQKFPNSPQAKKAKKLLR